MKTPNICLILLASAFSTFAQDTIIAENYFAHEIHDGKLTGNKLISYQYTYNLDSTLIFKIEYDKKTPRIEELTYFFYANKLLTSEETYTIEDGIKNIYRYSYTNSNKLSEVKYYETINNQVKLVHRKTYSYTNDKLTGITTLDANDKWINKTNITPADNQVIEETKYKKNTHPNNYKLKQISSTLKNGLVIAKHEYIVQYNNQEQNQYYKFEVDSLSGRVIKERKLDENKDLITTTEYIWRKDGTFRFKQVKDPAGLYLEYIRSKKFRHPLKFELREKYNLSSIQP